MVEGGAVPPGALRAQGGRGAACSAGAGPASLKTELKRVPAPHPGVRRTVLEPQGRLRASRQCKEVRHKARINLGLRPGSSGAEPGRPGGNHRIQEAGKRALGPSNPIYDQTPPYQADQGTECHVQSLKGEREDLGH